ncbi:opacity-associated protein OapA [Conservatibacter flavescens]|uniref:OapA protein n=1 Tax=Conservatibacter flavescens TaxID=28161 RepID=A0A2M8S1J8_9PAST|nr:opacity-associated protein OapA [Conservatibacter flavescens]PJG85005.1 OapA protein [Conservatibacter flavescens]
MDSEKRNPSDQPKQNELDLEFSQMEPITPKKIIEPKASLLDKAKGFIGSLNKKGEAMPNNTERKEPVFGDMSVGSSTHSDTAEPSLETSAPVQEPSHVEAESVHTQSTQDTTESQPMSPTQSSSNWKHPENWALLQKLPQKHRRLVVALAGAILLLLFFLWLKPESNTVDALQAQNSNNLPIEFQPLDQNEIQITEDPATDDISASDTGADSPSATPEQNAVNTSTTETHLAGMAGHIANSVSLASPQETTPVAAPVREVEKTPAQPQPQQAARPTPQPAKPAQTAQRPTERQNTAQRTERQEKAAAPKPAQTQPAQQPRTERKAAPVVEATPARTENRSTTASNTKTLTIQQGVSLMQVFRNHNLNISDVNAMTKANGAGNTLSSFKPGDKVQVSLNSNGRVTEMRLQDGTRFIRQADGTYIYRK